MKKILIVLCFSFLFFSCQSIQKLDFCIVDETYSIDKGYFKVLNEKVFNFGNKSGKSALMVMGIDRYNESIKEDIYSINSEALKTKFVNMINAEIRYSKDFNLDNSTPYKWKDRELTTVNSNFLVIVTDNKNDFFDYIIKYCNANNVKFDYFFMDIHGTPISIAVNDGQNSTYRAEMIKKFSKAKEIANCFSKNCSALAFSCSILSNEVSTPFALFLKAITGINNFSASKNATHLLKPTLKHMYRALGEFEKIPDRLSNNLIKIYDYYKTYVKDVLEENIAGYRRFNLTLTIPASILSEEYDNNKSNYYVVGRYNEDKAVFYKNNITDKIIINFDRLPWADMDFNNTKTVSSKEFCSFLEFLFEIHRGDKGSLLIE